MPAHKRALLYLVRKKGKTVLLLIIFLILATLMLTGISIGNAAQSSAAQLRASIGGYFKIAVDYDKMKINQYVDDSVIEKIMTDHRIKAFNAMNTLYLTTPELTLSPAKFSFEGDSKSQLTRFLTNTDSSLHEYFVWKAFRLTDGRHIAPDDKNAAIISSVLAAQNGLSVGDTLSAEITADSAVSQKDAPYKRFDFTIVGVFDEANRTQAGKDTPECDLPANFVFIDGDSGQKISSVLNGGKESRYSSGATFYAADPKELDAIVQNVNQAEGFDWNSLKLTVNNSAYEKAMAPLARLESMTNMIVVLIAVISVAVLSLLLTMWTRDRIHEAGVLMSVGTSKSKLFLQRLIEIVLVFAVSFLLACLLSGLLSGYLGTLLYSGAADAFAPQNIAESYGSAIMRDPVDFDRLADIPKFTAEIQPLSVALTGGMGILISTAATSLAFLPIWKKHPKDLLNMME